MKYIDAEKLLAEIQWMKKKPDITLRERNILIDVEIAIEFFQQGVSDKMDENTEDEIYNKALHECDIIERGQDVLCYGHLVEAFVAGAKWAMKRKEE